MDIYKAKLNEAKELKTIKAIRMSGELAHSPPLDRNAQPATLGRIFVPSSNPNRITIASSPSMSAKFSTAFASSLNPSFFAIRRLDRFIKSYTPSGDENLAVPPVGSVWFGPAA